MPRASSAGGLEDRRQLGVQPRIAGGLEPRGQRLLDGAEVVHTRKPTRRQPVGHDEQVDVRIEPRRTPADRPVHGERRQPIAIVAAARVEEIRQQRVVLGVHIAIIGGAPP